MFEKTRLRINDAEGMDSFTQSYKEFGIHSTKENGIFCQEWAPAAKAIYLRGDFSRCILNSEDPLIKKFQPWSNTMCIKLADGTYRLGLCSVKQRTRWLLTVLVLFWPTCCSSGNIYCMNDFFLLHTFRWLGKTGIEIWKQRTWKMAVADSTKPWWKLSNKA